MAPTLRAPIRGTSPAHCVRVNADILQQVLIDHAKKIAETYPQRYRYQYTKAAETLRAPYWDWAAGNGVPQATVPETTTINKPDGEALKETEVANPLYTFKFPKEALDGKFGDFDSEHRVQMYNCPAPNSYPDSANKNLAGRPYKQWVVSGHSPLNNVF